MSEKRTRGWIGAAAARADEIFANCRRRNRGSVGEVETLRDMVFEIADEVLRLQRVVEHKERQLADVRHPNRCTAKTRGAAS
ncbi:hypothetical protein [Embleya sp. NPDC059237]|uniref:hypothetical protein n=1 Tax=Embleya sp. NPDC059237 TaxID=3346784 RepID=UPI0036A12C2D